MIQVKLTKDSKHGKKGDVLYLKRNEAHTIIDGGVGKIYRPARVYKNTMMTTEKKTPTKKRYTTKKR